MNEAIPQLLTHDDQLSTPPSPPWQKKSHRSCLLSTDPEAFRLRWLGRKARPPQAHQRSLAQIRSSEARKPLGIRFNQLKQQIEGPRSPGDSEQPEP